MRTQHWWTLQRGFTFLSVLLQRTEMNPCCGLLNQVKVALCQPIRRLGFRPALTFYTVHFCTPGQTLIRDSGSITSYKKLFNCRKFKFGGWQLNIFSSQKSRVSNQNWPVRCSQWWEEKRRSTNITIWWWKSVACKFHRPQSSSQFVHIPTETDTQWTKPPPPSETQPV